MRKTYILTGAAGGLGTEAARILSTRDVNVLCVDRDDDSLEKLRAEVDGGAATFEFRRADVSQLEDVQGYTDLAMSTWGGLDGVFHMVGVEGAMREFVDLDIEEFDRMIQVNSRSVWYGMKLAIPHLMARGGGRIVNTASYVGFRGTLRTSAYGASKHAVVGMSKGVAMEYAAKGVSINVLAPGAMDTPMIRTVFERAAPGDLERGRELTLLRMPSRSLADPKDVAATGVWLMTESPIHLTGQVVPVDGGASI